MNKNKSNTNKTTNSKKWLIAGASVLGVTAITFASLFIWKCLTATGGSGGSYKPGQQVTVKSVVDDPSGNYTVTLGSNEAKVGEKYHTEINLTPKNATNDEYVLPDKLVSIVSNTTALKEEQYKYTLGQSKTTAELDIEGEFVCGPINVSLVLVSTSQPGPAPEEWVDIENSDAAAIASRLYSLYDSNAKQLTYLLRKQGAQGKFTSHTEGTGMSGPFDINNNLTFDLRNIEPGKIDKDVYLKREYIDNLSPASNTTEYNVYLPNSKKTEVDKVGLYFFRQAYGEASPTGNIYSGCSISSPYEVEEKINRNVYSLFRDDIASLLLIGGDLSTEVMDYISKLFDPEASPEDVEASFQSKNESSLRGSCSGSINTAIEDMSCKVTMDVSNIVVSDYIVTSINVDLEITFEDIPAATMTGSYENKLEYKEIVNEYNPSWPITI